MIAKLTSNNQLTLPNAIAAAFSGEQLFDVTQENGKIVLTPLGHDQADATRAKLAALGIDEADIRDAIAWARNRA